VPSCSSASATVSGDVRAITRPRSTIAPSARLTSTEPSRRASIAATMPLRIVSDSSRSPKRYRTIPSCVPTHTHPSGVATMQFRRMRARVSPFPVKRTRSPGPYASSGLSDTTSPASDPTHSRPERSSTSSRTIGSPSPSATP
jgi:hypothetical protein